MTAQAGYNRDTPPPQGPPPCGFHAISVRSFHVFLNDREMGFVFWQAASYIYRIVSLATR